MKYFLLPCLAALLVLQTAKARETPLLFAQSSGQKVQVVTAGKRTFCITGNTVYLVEKNGLTQTATLRYGCNDATLYNNNIVLATNHGLQYFNTQTFALSNLLGQTLTTRITNVQTDGENRVWFIKEFEGCFIINDKERIEQRLQVPVAYSLAYTNNGNMWVGTNVGLYQIPLHGGYITRYAEEGIASEELPDNLVERLFADKQSNLWILMPGHTTFLAADSEEDQPDFEHIGKANNELFDIAPAARSSYLFATAQGVLLLPRMASSSAGLTGEIHQTINKKAYLLDNRTIGKPNAWKEEPIIKISAVGKETLFVTQKGLWRVKTEKLMHRLEELYPM